MPAASICDTATRYCDIHRATYILVGVQAVMDAYAFHVNRHPLFMLLPAIEILQWRQLLRITLEITLKRRAVPPLIALRTKCQSTTCNSAGYIHYDKGQWKQQKFHSFGVHCFSEDTYDLMNPTPHLKNRCPMVFCSSNATKDNTVPYPLFYPRDLELPNWSQSPLDLTSV